MSIEDWDDPKVNRKLIQFLDEAIQGCEQAYEGHSRSFAVILSDLEKLRMICGEKLSLSEGVPAKATTERTAVNLATQAELEKQTVYVRLFHKDMTTLNSPNPATGWIKPLFESIKLAEKHGLAIYEDEDNARKSLKDDRYGYVEVTIMPEQDITDKRPPKQDTAQGCTLLTVENIQVDQMKRFHHQGVDYPIIGGVLQTPNKGTSN
ncbi:MAG: hypothetical protein CMF50_07820 [Legionellales bacterium]|nr:hypothetical protein [Legionellales bacterium]|tara:strand:- start:10431 stop:11051 length:621 start_codon:yes stop_codon:yes gene_type:complete